ncbi:MAG: flagellar basal body P-ring formation protein FlgA [Gammaproteobacteria bacterium]|nr:flagellar basal body P-ring formation protein FlgA [Gammaproteobacteria bacterium]
MNTAYLSCLFRFPLFFLVLVLVICGEATHSTANPVVPVMASFIKRADTVVSKHPLIADRQHRVTWMDMPTTIPGCSVALRDDLKVINKSDSEKAAIYTLICRGTVRWTRTFRGKVVFAGELLVADSAIPTGTKFSKGLFRRQNDSQSSGGAAVPDERFKGFWGRQATRAIRTGEPLDLNDWVRTTVIFQGSKVKVIVQGQGFTVDAEGEALDSAAIGESLRVKLTNGTIIQGLVKAESVVVYNLP